MPRPARRPHDRERIHAQEEYETDRDQGYTQELHAINSIHAVTLQFATVPRDRQASKAVQSQSCALTVKPRGQPPPSGKRPRRTLLLRLRRSHSTPTAAPAIARRL